MISLSLISPELQNILSQKIRDLYQSQLNHPIKAINYHVFEKSLIIILEGTVTPAEQLLQRHNQKQLAYQMRSVLDNIIQPQLKKIIENSIEVKVVDFLCDTAIETGQTGAIVVFELKSILHNNNKTNLNQPEEHKSMVVADNGKSSPPNLSVNKAYSYIPDNPTQ